MDVVDAENKYKEILASMISAQLNAYAGPVLATMLQEWWDQAL
jgi:hypothetical protein